MRVIDAYLHTAPSGRAYVGIASAGWRDRWRSHVFEARQGSTTPLHSAIRKYGPDAFETRVLQVCVNRLEAEAAERYWIKALGTHVRNGGYNATDGGEGVSGLSDDARAKISAALIGRTYSAQTIERMRAGQVGMVRPRSAEHNAKISAALTGVKRSAETCERMSTVRLGTRASAETRAKMSAAHKARERSPDVGASISAAKRQYPRLRIAPAWAAAGTGWSRDRSSARFEL
jgi:group I intron endonuclease